MCGQGSQEGKVSAECEDFSRWEIARPWAGPGSSRTLSAHGALERCLALWSLGKLLSGEGWEMEQGSDGSQLSEAGEERRLP